MTIYDDYSNDDSYDDSYDDEDDTVGWRIKIKKYVQFGRKLQ